MGKAFEFTVVLRGYGETADEAWQDAVEAFGFDPGSTPEEFAIIEEDDNGNEITETSDGTYSG